MTVELPPLEDGYRGSVNRWECDENDHMNVRFFGAKLHEGLSLFLDDPAPAVDAFHLRFVREARLAAPLVVGCALTMAGSGREVMTIMRHARQPMVYAAATMTLATPPGRSTPAAALPETLGRRGLAEPLRTAPFPSLAAAQTAGFQLIGQGRLTSGECDARGMLPPTALLGRSSDAMPIFWCTIEPEQEALIGTAVLEFQLTMLEPLKAHDSYAIASAVTGVARSTQVLTHLFYRWPSGTPVAVAQAVGVSMDLEARRAAPMSDARRARLTERMVALP